MADAVAGVGAAGAVVEARCAVPFTPVFCGVAGGSRIRIARFAVSSASLSAGSLGAETFAGRRTAADIWTAGGACDVTAGGADEPCSRADDAMERAMSACVP
jgi:hypothetical protein